MKPVDDVEQLVQQLKHCAAPEFRAAVRQKMLAELDRAGVLKPRSLWRIVMTGRVTRYAAAGSIAVAVLLAAVFLSGLFVGNHGVVLAEVAKKTQAIDTFIHREKRVFYRTGEDKPSLLGNAVKYASSNLGHVEKQYDADGGLVYSAYCLRKEKRVVLLFPALKRYLDLPLTERHAALTDDVSPQGLVRLLTRHGYSKLGRADFDDRAVEGFEMSRESIDALVSAFQDYTEVRMLFPVSSAAARLWIDVKTSLPVGVEAELATGGGLLTGFQAGELRITAYDFQWNPEIDPKVFVPEIPADYERMDLPPISK